jgi:hypothetical protein
LAHWLNNLKTLPTFDPAENQTRRIPQVHPVPIAQSAMGVPLVGRRPPVLPSQLTVRWLLAGLVRAPPAVSAVSAVVRRVR